MRDSPTSCDACIDDHYAGKKRLKTYRRAPSVLIALVAVFILNQRKKMKSKFIACAVAFAALLPGLSEAKGCLKGAAVGGVGGHFAGHHGLIGAAAGCAVGHHLANKPRPEKNSATPTTQSAQQQQLAPGTH